MTCPTCGAAPGGPGFMTGRPMIQRRNFLRAHRALHVLWTRAVGELGYDKPAWKELDAAIYRLATDGPGELVTGGGNPQG